ncbi:MAG: glycosyltransferase [Gammaproteobacteria bacterium]|nr:glycosyltransferase [Gammaproteobacteria bacterium]
MANKQKLAIILANYFEQCSGGAELQAYYLAQCAKQSGWDVSYIFISNGNSYQNSLDIHLYPIPKIELFAKLGNIKFFYGFHIWTLLKTIKPDAIYQRAGSSLTAIAALYSRTSNSQMIFHLASSHELNNRSSLNLFKIIEYRLTRYGQKHAQSVIAQTQQQADRYHSLFQRRVTHIVANGHPIPEGVKKTTTAIQIVWIGNMKPVKQPEIFIQLGAELNKDSEISCIMIGRIDNYAEQINTAVNNHFIKAPGELANDEVNRILEQSHILVNTSLYEGFSNTFIQAWMRKTPVISLNANPDSVITRYNMGYHSKTFEQLLSDTRSLIQNAQLRHAMASNAETYATTHHSLNNFKTILNCFDQS